MEKSAIIGKIVSLIKRKKPEVIKFISSHGGVVKRNDSDVNIGKSLSALLSKGDKKTHEDFARLLHSSLSADGDAASDAAFYTAGSVGTPKVTTTVAQSTTSGTTSTATKSGSGTFGAILGGVTGLFTTASTNKAATQQSSDAITLALINAGIAKQKTSPVLTISLIVLAVIIVGIIAIIILKKKKS